MSDTKQFWTVEEAAAILTLHPETIRRMIRRGELQAAKVAGRLRVPQTALDALKSQPAKVSTVATD
jgi:excisionase family DNA binding protein